MFTPFGIALVTIAAIPATFIFAMLYRTLMRVFGAPEED